jgi:hypothetical protein
MIPRFFFRRDMNLLSQPSSSAEAPKTINEQWRAKQMERYSLTSAAKPTLSGPQKQAVYELLMPYGNRHSFSEILSNAYKTNYRSLLRDDGQVTVPESLCHHLRDFRKREFLTVIED